MAARGVEASFGGDVRFAGRFWLVDLQGRTPNPLANAPPPTPGPFARGHWGRR